MKRVLMVLLILTTAGIKLSAQTKGRKAPAGKAQIVSAAVVANGKKIYNQYCLTCHMADGGGVQNMNPPLIKTTYVLGDKTRLIKILLNGLSDGIEIDGETYTNIMPQQNSLTDLEIANVLTFVRNSFGNKASQIKAAEVKAIRAANK